MSVEFQVSRIGTKVVSIKTDSPHISDWEGEVPLVSTEMASTSTYTMPDDQAKDHKVFLILQK